MILDFDKPKKARSTETHNDMHGSDSGVAGTYVPNMSAAAMKRWKAKQVQGADPRIEIRKTVEGTDPGAVKPNRRWSGHCHAQLLITVRKKSIVMSTNGRMVFDVKTWTELHQAVGEAQTILMNNENE